MTSAELRRRVAYLASRIEQLLASPSRGTHKEIIPLMAELYPLLGPKTLLDVLDIIAPDHRGYGVSYGKMDENGNYNGVIDEDGVLIWLPHYLNKIEAIVLGKYFDAVVHFEKLENGSFLMTEKK